VGRAPGCLARIAEIVPEQTGVETALRRLEIAAGLFTSPTQLTEGFIFHGGDVDGREISRPPYASQGDRIAAVRVHPVTRLFGAQRGGHAPADVACFAQRPGEPGAAGAGVVAKHQGLGLRVPWPEEVLAVGLSRANRAEVNDWRVRLSRDGGNRHRVWMDSHSDVEHGRRWHG